MCTYVISRVPSIINVSGLGWGTRHDMLLKLVLALTFLVSCTLEGGSDARETHSWAVKLSEDSSPAILNAKADALARECGVVNLGTIGRMSTVFEFGMRAEENQSDLVDHLAVEKRLASHTAVQWVSIQRPLKRVGRSFRDPYFLKQWHLVNTKEPGHDINVTTVWKLNITGEGVVIAVVDDGLEHNNPDLALNYNEAGSYDFNSNDNDPSPDTHHAYNSHGTKCAGVIAAVPNDICVVGVAYGAQVSGLRILDGQVTDILEGRSFVYESHINHIYSCSWGPDDDGKTVEGPGFVTQEALQLAAEQGRCGYGNIFVFASGNGGIHDDNCNFDGYANSIYTVTIGAIDERNEVPSYAEKCAAMLAVTYSNGEAGGDRNIATTDTVSLGGCTESFTGTSAAAPIASGLIALVLQVRPCLTWRDVQYLLVFTAVRVDPQHTAWVTNGAGLAHSDWHGFGLLDAFRMTQVAMVWPLVPPMVHWSSPHDKQHYTIPPDGKPLQLSINVKGTSLPAGLVTVEHVAVTITLEHPYRGAVSISLTSPHGTKSLLASYRRNDDSDAAFSAWTFATVKNWGEPPVGVWKLDITSNPKIGSAGHSSGELRMWYLTIYGSSVTAADILNRQSLVEGVVSGSQVMSPLECPTPVACPGELKLPALQPSIKRWFLLVLLIVAGTGVLSLCCWIVGSVWNGLWVWSSRRVKGVALFVRRHTPSGVEEAALLQPRGAEEDEEEEVERKGRSVPPGQDMSDNAQRLSMS